MPLIGLLVMMVRMGLPAPCSAALIQVEGRVADAATNAPVEAALIQVPAAGTMTVTGADGRYRIMVDPGRPDDITVLSPGYLPAVVRSAGLVPGVPAVTRLEPAGMGPLFNMLRTGGVNLFTGNYASMHVDWIENLHDGCRLRVLRSWHGLLAGVPGPFGPGWRCSLVGERLRELGNGDVLYERANGERVRFVRLAAGTWSPPAGMRASLERGPDGTWLLSSRTTGNRARLDARGRLVELQDYAGNRTRLNHLEDRLVVALPRGTTMEILFDGSGRITGVIDSKRQVHEYLYDPAGHLGTFIKDPVVSNQVLRDSLFRDWSWDSAGRPIRWWDRVFTWDSRGRLVALDDARSPRRLMTCEYRDELRETYVPETRITHAFDAQGRPASQSHPAGTWRYEWAEPLALRRVSTSRGESYDYLYDAAGRVTEVRSGMQVVARYEWHPFEWRLQSYTDRQGRVRRVEHDPGARPAVEAESRSAMAPSPDLPEPELPVAGEPVWIDQGL